MNHVAKMGVVGLAYVIYIWTCNSTSNIVIFFKNRY